MSDRSRRYYENHYQTVRARTRANYLARREEIIVWRKAHYQAHRAEYLARAREWAITHPDARRSISRRSARRLYRIRKRAQLREILGGVNVST
jgi:hypothetical protein